MNVGQMKTGAIVETDFSMKGHSHQFPSTFQVCLIGLEVQMISLSLKLSLKHQNRFFLP